MTDMLKKSEKINTSDAYVKSDNLTEQFKKGELINGKKYYITFCDSEPFEATFRAAEAIFPFWKFEANGRKYCDENGYDCVKVLAPVPSYELWKAVHEQRNVLFVENIKLKDLLKECKHIMSIEKDFASCHFEKDKLCKLLTKINQVLG